MVEVLRYQTASGEEPITDWLHSLRDKQAQAKASVLSLKLLAEFYCLLAAALSRSSPGAQPCLLALRASRRMQ